MAQASGGAVRTGRNVESIRRLKARRKSEEKRLAREESGVKGFDFVFFALVIILCGIGLVMVTSASVYTAYADQGDSLYYFRRQLLCFGLGMGAMVLCMFIPSRFYFRGAIVAYLISLALQILVLMIGVEVNGSRRWLEFFGIQFQPSEIAKIATAIFMSVLVYVYRDRMHEWKIMLMLFGVLIVPTGLIFTTNLSTSIINAIIGLVIIYVGGASNKKFWPVILLGILFLVFILTLPLYADIDTFPGFIRVIFSKLAYRTDRIRAWIDPFAYADGDGYQVIQSMYTIASGGLTGCGIGGGIQKLGYIPEAYNDIIFAVIVEETGLIGAAVVIGLFIWLVLRGMKIARQARYRFEKYVVIGLIGQVAVQAIINIAVNTNTVPVTGVTLPFISYGGTSLVILMASMGIILGISRHREWEPARRRRRKDTRETGGVREQ